MAENCKGIDRRILSFPTVHPCEDIHPITLVNSMISLCHNIRKYQSELLPTQRRNARDTMRQIGILLLFLEEIRDRSLEIADSDIRSFFELHICFQKFRFLMEDCTHDGARLWMLMKSQLVATQFRLLIRDVATALDVLPLERIEVCEEVKELVGLVAKQARQVKFELDPNDERTMKQVHVVLYQFEKGVEPDPVSIKQVLDYLGIKSWSDCNKEIEFLEGSISIQLSDCNQKEVPFLHSLVGFLSYSRGVIFEALNFRNAAEKSEGKLRMKTTLSCLNPEEFRCPISLELMRDPVIVSTGQTFDRFSIQKWLKAGNLICPKTGKKLTSTELIPNTALKEIIHQFCANNGVSLAKLKHQNHDITRTVSPGSQAAAAAIQFVSHVLARRLVFGSNEQKKNAAYEIRVLAKSNIFNRFCLIQAGTVSPLINLLSSKDTPTQENAIGALLKLSKHPRGKTEIIENCGLQSILIDVLKNGLSLEAKQIAAATLFYMSSVKECRKLIGEHPEAIPDLVKLIKEGTTCGKKNAVVAIFGLLFRSKNHERVLAAGTVPLLVSILESSDNTQLKTDCLSVLSSLAETVNGTVAILQSSALPLITGILRGSGSRTDRDSCVSIFLSVCINGGVEGVASLAKDPSLLSSLYSFLEDEPCHPKKAQSLIKFLQEFKKKKAQIKRF